MASVQFRETPCEEVVIDFGLDCAAPSRKKIGSGSSIGWDLLGAAQPNFGAKGKITLPAVIGSHVLLGFGTQYTGDRPTSVLQIYAAEKLIFEQIHREFLQNEGATNWSASDAGSPKRMGAELLSTRNRNYREIKATTWLAKSSRLPKLFRFRFLTPIRLYPDFLQTVERDLQDTISRGGTGIVKELFGYDASRTLQPGDLIDIQLNYPVGSEGLPPAGNLVISSDDFEKSTWTIATSLNGKILRAQVSEEVVRAFHKSYLKRNSSVYNLIDNTNLRLNKLVNRYERQEGFCNGKEANPHEITTHVAEGSGIPHVPNGLGVPRLPSELCNRCPTPNVKTVKAPRNPIEAFKFYDSRPAQKGTQIPKGSPNQQRGSTASTTPRVLTTQRASTRDTANTTPPLSIAQGSSNTAGSGRRISTKAKSDTVIKTRISVTDPKVKTRTSVADAKTRTSVSSSPTRKRKRRTEQGSLSLRGLISPKRKKRSRSAAPIEGKENRDHGNARADLDRPGITLNHPGASGIFDEQGQLDYISGSNYEGDVPYQDDHSGEYESGFDYQGPLNYQVDRYHDQDERYYEHDDVQYDEFGIPYGRAYDDAMPHKQRCMRTSAAMYEQGEDADQFSDDGKVYYQDDVGYAAQDGRYQKVADAGYQEHDDYHARMDRIRTAFTAFNDGHGLSNEYNGYVGVSNGSRASLAQLQTVLDQLNAMVASLGSARHSAAMAPDTAPTSGSSGHANSHSADRTSDSDGDDDKNGDLNQGKYGAKALTLGGEETKEFIVKEKKKATVSVDVSEENEDEEKAMKDEAKAKLAAAKPGGEMTKRKKSPSDLWALRDQLQEIRKASVAVHEQEMFDWAQRTSTVLNTRYSTTEHVQSTYRPGIDRPGLARMSSFGAERYFHAPERHPPGTPRGATLAHAHEMHSPLRESHRHSALAHVAHLGQVNIAPIHGRASVSLPGTTDAHRASHVEDRLLHSGEYPIQHAHDAYGVHAHDAHDPPTHTLGIGGHQGGRSSHAGDHHMGGHHDPHLHVRSPPKFNRGHTLEMIPSSLSNANSSHESIRSPSFRPSQHRSSLRHPSSHRVGETRITDMIQPPVPSKRPSEAAAKSQGRPSDYSRHTVHHDNTHTTTQEVFVPSALTVQAGHRATITEQDIREDGKFGASANLRLESEPQASQSIISAERQAGRERLSRMGRTSRTPTKGAPSPRTSIRGSPDMVVSRSSRHTSNQEHLHQAAHAVQALAGMGQPLRGNRPLTHAERLASLMKGLDALQGPSASLPQSGTGVTNTATNNASTNTTTMSTLAVAGKNNLNHGNPNPWKGASQTSDSARNSNSDRQVRSAYFPEDHRLEETREISYPGPLQSSKDHGNTDLGNYPIGDSRATGNSPGPGTVMSRRASLPGETDAVGGSTQSPAAKVASTGGRQQAGERRSGRTTSTELTSLEPHVTTTRVLGSQSDQSRQSGRHSRTTQSYDYPLLAESPLQSGKDTRLPSAGAARRASLPGRASATGRVFSGGKVSTKPPMPTVFPGTIEFQSTELGRFREMKKMESIKNGLQSQEMYPSRIVAVAEKVQKTKMGSMNKPGSRMASYLTLPHSMHSHHGDRVPRSFNQYGKMLSERYERLRDDVMKKIPHNVLKKNHFDEHFLHLMDPVEKEILMNMEREANSVRMLNESEEDTNKTNTTSTNELNTVVTTGEGQSGSSTGNKLGSKIGSQISGVIEPPSQEFMKRSNTRDHQYLEEILGIPRDNDDLEIGDADFLSTVEALQGQKPGDGQTVRKSLALQAQKPGDGQKAQKSADKPEQKSGETPDDGTPTPTTPRGPAYATKMDPSEMVPFPQRNRIPSIKSINSERQLPVDKRYANSMANDDHQLPGPLPVDAQLPVDARFAGLQQRPDRPNERFYSTTAHDAERLRTRHTVTLDSKPDRLYARSSDPNPSAPNSSSPIGVMSKQVEARQFQTARQFEQAQHLAELAAQADEGELGIQSIITHAISVIDEITAHEAMLQEEDEPMEAQKVEEARQTAIRQEEERQTAIRSSKRAKESQVSKESQPSKQIQQPLGKHSSKTADQASVRGSDKDTKSFCSRRSRTSKESSKESAKASSDATSKGSDSESATSVKVIYKDRKPYHVRLRQYVTGRRRRFIRRVLKNTGISLSADKTNRRVRAYNRRLACSGTKKPSTFPWQILGHYFGQTTSPFITKPCIQEYSIRAAGQLVNDELGLREIDETFPQPRGKMNWIEFKSVRRVTCKGDVYLESPLMVELEDPGFMRRNLPLFGKESLRRTLVSGKCEEWVYRDFRLTHGFLLNLKSGNCLSLRDCKVEVEPIERANFNKKSEEFFTWMLMQNGRRRYRFGSYDLGLAQRWVKELVTVCTYYKEKDLLLSDGEEVSVNALHDVVTKSSQDVLNNSDNLNVLDTKTSMNDLFSAPRIHMQVTSPRTDLYTAPRNDMFTTSTRGNKLLEATPLAQSFTPMYQPVEYYERVEIFPENNNDVIDLTPALSLSRDGGTPGFTASKNGQGTPTATVIARLDLPTGNSGRIVETKGNTIASLQMPMLQLPSYRAPRHQVGISLFPPDGLSFPMIQNAPSSSLERVPPWGALSVRSGYHRDPTAFAGAAHPTQLSLAEERKHDQMIQALQHRSDRGNCYSSDSMDFNCSRLKKRRKFNKTMARRVAQQRRTNMNEPLEFRRKINTSEDRIWADRWRNTWLAGLESSWKNPFSKRGQIRAAESSSSTAVRTQKETWLSTTTWSRTGEESSSNKRQGNSPRTATSLGHHIVRTKGRRKGKWVCLLAVLVVLSLIGLFEYLELQEYYKWRFHSFHWTKHRVFR